MYTGGTHTFQFDYYVLQNIIALCSDTGTYKETPAGRVIGLGVILMYVVIDAQKRYNIIIIEWQI